MICQQGKTLVFLRKFRFDDITYNYRCNVSLMRDFKILEIENESCKVFLNCYLCFNSYLQTSEKTNMKFCGALDKILPTILLISNTRDH